MKIAFLGLGIMGSRMARNLLKQGFSLTVYNRSPEPVRELEQAGAHAAGGFAEAVAHADIVVSMLASPAVLETVALGDDGFVGAIKEGALWIECSTVNPSFTAREQAAATARGVRFMDAPVAGTKGPAEKGELTFLVGATDADLEQARPLLEAMGAKTVHVGEVGRGAGFKMLVNAMLAQNMLVFSETLLLGERLGLSRDFLLDTLPKLPVSAPFLGAKAELIRGGDYQAQFPLEWMHKDLQLLSQTAYEQDQPLFLANLAKEIYAEAKHEKGRHDFAAIYQYLAEKASS